MSDPYVGEIRIFGGNYAPVDWAICDGRLLSIAEYQALYALIGNMYGGDNITTFAVPNLQSRIPIHYGTNAGTTYEVSQTGGSETVALTTQQTPAHTHIPQATNVTGALPNPSSNLWAKSTANQFTAGAANAVMNANALSTIGNNAAHDNMMPFMALNFIIALNGYFPQND